MNCFIASIEDNVAFLNSEESFHCAKVLRYKPGQLIRVANGHGLWGEAQLSKVHEKQCEAIIRQLLPSQKRPVHLHLAIAPTKQIDRIEWLLEKCVELGIEEISFLQCQNSERTTIKKERLEKIVESAFKQSFQAYLPKVNELVKFKDILISNAIQKYIAHCEAGDKQLLNKVSFLNTSSLILIGPEGDFSPEEIQMAQNKQFQALNLGANRLRTETAGLIVCSAAALEAMSHQP
jgi:16S rRNA (uracil1498-N3)-methyltransferase